MHPQSTASDHRLSYELPRELVLVGKYVRRCDHLADLPPLSTHELAWAAGFFDGEGCTCLAHHGRRRNSTPCCDISQIHPYVLERFRAAVGGLGSIRRRPDPLNKRHSVMWSYTTRNWRDTQVVLTVLWPFLSLVKRQQAAVVFERYQADVVLMPNLGRRHAESLFRPQGELNAGAKVVEATVREIRRRCALGAKQIDLAAEYGLDKASINDIVRRKTWTHLPADEPVLPLHAGNRTLREDDVRNIRALAAGGMPQARLAVQFVVSRPTICNIVRRRTWRHLD